jgi:hypothetical protein
VLKKGVNASMLKDEVLKGIANICYIKYLILIKGCVRGVLTLITLVKRLSHSITKDI